MNDWLSEIEERKFGNSDIKRMTRVLRELGASIPLLRNIYTSMFMSEGRNEGLPPQVQYWLQEIPNFLDNLSDDARELCVASQESSREE